MAARPSPPSTADDELRLGVPGFTFADLHVPERLADLHARFLADLRAAAPDVAARFDAYRAGGGEGMTPQAVSAVLAETAPHVGAFVARLFGVEAERARLIAETRAQDPVWRMKDQLVKRRAWKRGEVPFDAAVDAAARALLAAAGAAGAPSPPDPDDELAVAKLACALLDREAELKRTSTRPDEEIAGQLELLEKWIMMRRRDPAVRGWVCYRQPRPMDHQALVELVRPRPDRPEELVGPLAHRRHRDGFRLTDRRMAPQEVLSEVDYCLYCHDRSKDSCARGLRGKDGAPRPNPLGVPLAGCPLEERISEAHLVKKQGDSIGALALIAIDNPMVPGTGHRICNDCMKACIFQRQDPVNVPQIETRILCDVLELPWGLEIYALFTRWNPLNLARPFPRAYHGKNVLVVGLGPAGYTLCHYLLNEGFGVVAVDGLKIEPLPAAWLAGPIRDVRALTSEQGERVLYGFGGVSEYGITARWDKSFLEVIHRTLARRSKLRCYGGTRFGGTITLEDTWAYGFDHVAVAAGAGKPTLVELDDNLLRGIRKASDFLMGLQLTGAYQRSKNANLQVRLPAVVIGGGLTAIDAATEVRAYYVVQVEKALDRHDAAAAAFGVEAVRARFDAEELGVLDELCGHGRQVRAERARAAAQGRGPDFDALLDAWGGVTIAYRKRLQDSPAYRLNHEEIIKGLEEGIRFLEQATPKAAIADEHGALRAVTFARADGSVVELPARTLLVAAGTSPNTIYEKEHPGAFRLDRKGFFQAHRAARGADGRVTVEPGDGCFTSYLDAPGHTVSYYGDNHPRYAGSVVKAMASARDGHRQVVALFAGDIEAALADPAGQAAREAAWARLAARLDDDLRPTVVAVNRLTPTIVEVVLRAPAQARKFRPGQFFRLQNFESLAPVVAGSKLAAEGLALTGAWVDPDRGLLALIVLEMGGSSRLVATLRPGERVVVMGPTGAPTEIPHGETVLLAGGGLGNAVLFSIARALRAAGNRVIYFAGYKHPRDLFKQEEIEAANDVVIWATDVAPAIPPRRPQDRSFVGNIVQAMLAYARGELGPPVCGLREVDRVIAIGSDRMMAAVAAARHGVLAPYLAPDHVGIGSINSPMQCMMKEVCAQCLQRHLDPATGQLKEIVFTCFNQDQPLDEVDWKHLHARLRQNTVQEKLANLWLDCLLRQRPDLRRV